MHAGWARALVKSSVPALTRQPRRVVASVTVGAFEDRIGPLATRGGASRHRVRERAQWSGGELGVPKEVLVDLHARSSEVIRGHQRSSEVIRGHQRRSPRGPACKVIRGHQRSSKVIRGLQAPGRFAARQRARALSWRRRNRRGAGSRRTCTPIMYHHVSSHAIMCPRQSAAGMPRISVPVGKARVTQLAVEGVAHGRRWEDEDFGASVQKVIVRNLDHGRGLPGAGSVDNEHPGIRQAAGMAQEGDSLLVALEPRFDRLPYPLDRA